MAELDLGTTHLRFERRGPIAWCFVDRADARNALTPAMYRGLGLAVAEVTDAPDLHALVITALGDVFVAGGDLNIGDADRSSRNAPSATLPFSRLRHASIPVVVAVNGICQASGLVLTLLADVAIASENATFRAPELLRGFADMWLAAVLPAHIGVGRARELVMTARRIDAEEARSLGIVQRVVPHGELEAKAQQAALELLETAPHARVALKRAINQRYGVIDEFTMDTMPSSPEVAEGFAAFIDKRSPAWSPKG